MSGYPAAGCATLAPLLAGPSRAVEVIAATATAVYVATGDPETPALCLCTARAVRVPCALVLGPGTRPPGVAVGERGEVGGGRLALHGRTVRVARWWPPARPRRVVVDPDELAHLPSPWQPSSPWQPLPSWPGADRAGWRWDVPALLGRGEGLTPIGDDILAGLLVTLTVLDPPAARRLAERVDALAPARTTAVSAALLRHAGRGECVPELAALLHGAPGALAALRRVGHTSGTGLAWGVRLALGAAPARDLGRFDTASDVKPAKIRSGQGADQ